MILFPNISYANDVLYENKKFKAYYPVNWTYDEDHPNTSYGDGTWSNCMYNDGYHNSGYSKDTPYTKILWLTKNDILKWKKGSSLIFPHKDMSVWQSISNPIRFSAHASIWILNGSEYNRMSEFKFEKSSTTGTDENAITTITLGSDMTIPSNATPVYFIHPVTTPTWYEYSSDGSGPYKHGGKKYIQGEYSTLDNLDKKFRGYHNYNDKAIRTSTYSWKLPELDQKGNVLSWTEVSVDPTPYYGKLEISILYSFKTDKDDGGIGGTGTVNKMYVSDGVIHTHSYTKKVVDKQATCTSAGSGHYECPTDGAKNGATYTIPALGHSFGSWSAWANSSNTEQKRTRTCSRCGKVETETKTRTYVVDLNIYGPNGNQVDPVDGGYGFGSVQLSIDNKSWSNDLRNEGSEPRLRDRHYQDKIYIKYCRPKYDYLEFCIIRGQNDTGTYTLPTVKEGENIWYYTVSPWTTTSAYTGGNINVYMQYKHTTLTLDPMGGFINNNTEVKTLSPQMQYSTNTWNNLSGQKPTRYGYTFEGWYDAATGGTKVYNTDGSCVKDTKYFDSNGNSLCVNDLTVYAHWTPTTYNIYYTLFGSAASIKRTYTIETDSFTLPIPTLSGYIFKGWVGGIDRSDPVYKETNIDSSEIRKTININKGSYGDRFYRAIFEKAHSVDDAKNRTDDIYIAQSKPKEEQILAVRVDFDLNLPIPENGRALTVKANPSYIKSIYYKANDFYMDPQYKIQSPILKDYIFLGWYTEREGGTQITSGLRVINTENHTLYAHWKPQNVKILSLSGNDISLKTGTSADINVNATFDDTKTWVGKDNDVWTNNAFFTHNYGTNMGMVASIHAPFTDSNIVVHNIDDLQKDFKVRSFNQTTGQSYYSISAWLGFYYSTNVIRGKKYHMEFDYMVNDDNIPIRCGIENGWNIIINPGKYTVSGIPSVSASANEWHHISKDFIYNNTIDNYHAFIIYAYARSTWCKDPLLWDNFSFKIKNMHFQEYESADATDYIAEWEYKSADGNWQKMNLQNVTESGTTLQIANADKTLNGTKVRLKMYNNAGKYKVSNEITIHVE